MASQPAVQPAAEHFGDWLSKPEDLHLETFKEKGRGSYGVVYVGEWQGRSVAVKMVHDILLEVVGRQKEALVKNFKEECQKLSSLNHRRVVKLIATFRDERGRPLLIMEAMEESLELYLLRNDGKLSVLRQITIVNELADGLAYLHENNIVHRDLKPANVLIGKDGNIRIADLGQAKLLANIEQLMQTPQPGTVQFVPPEALRGDGSDSYTFSIDCFSLGVVALCVATQSLPTCGLTEIGTVEEAVRRKNDLDKLPKGHPLEAIILGCLQNTPSLRPQSVFIKEHTHALMEIEDCKSLLERQDKTVIQQGEELQTQKEQIDYLQEEEKAKDIAFAAAEEKWFQERTELKSELSRYVVLMAKLESEVATRGGQNLSLELALAEKALIIEQLKDEQKVKVREFEAAEEKWLQEKTEIKSELSRCVVLEAKLQSEVTTRDVQILSLEKALDKKASIIEQLEDEQKVKVREFEATEEKWSQERTKLKSELSRCVELEAKLQSEVATRDVQILSLELALDEKASIIEQLKDEQKVKVREFEATEEKWLQEKTELKSECVELEAKLQSEVATRGDQNLAWELKLDEKVSIIEQLKDQLKACQDTISTLEEGNKRCIEQIQSLEDQRLDDTIKFETRITTLESSLATVQMNSKVQNDNYCDGLTDIERLLQNVETRVATLRSKVSEDSTETHQKPVQQLVSTLETREELCAKDVTEKLHVVKGNLASHKADVYVTTASASLDLNNGAVAQSLLKAGGPQLQKECTDYVQQLGRVPDWGHAVTRGGNLQCRHAIHAVVAHATTRDSIQGMSTMITNIMAECERLGATSVAFPAIGTGQLGFTIGTVASIMVQVVASFLQNNPSSCLKTVLFVLFDDKTLTAFDKQHSALLPAPQPSSASGEENESKRHSSTGAHVEWTNSQPVHRTALLSNAHEPTPHPVTNATPLTEPHTSDSKRSESSSYTNTTQSQGRMHESVISTSSQQTQAPGGSASLHYFQLGSVNVQIIHGDLTNEKCDGLVSTSSENLYLQAFGVMGALLKKGGPELQQECSIAAAQHGNLSGSKVIVTGVGRPGGLTCTRILHVLAPNHSGQLCNVVAAVLKKANEENLSVVALPANCTGAHEFTPKESAKGIYEAIAGFGRSKPNHTKVLKLVLFEEGHYNQFSHEFNAVVAQSRSKGWFQKLLSLSKTSSHTVSNVSSQLQVHGNLPLNPHSTLLPPAWVSFYWQWKFSKSGAFVSISPVANEKIEVAYLSGQKCLPNVLMIPDEPPFSLNFLKMVAVPSMAPLKSVKIQRVPLKVEHSGPDISTTNSNPEVINVRSNSQEYKAVWNDFQRSMTPQHCAVISIQRINNLSLWTRYSSRKAAMTQGHPTESCEEKWLFHKCPVEKVQEVQQHGFNRTHSLREDLGKGMYFTEDSQSSLTHGHNHPLKYMFLARVLTGHYTKGTYAVTTPPPTAGRHPQDVYNYVVDDVGNPKVFVVFSEDQAYPEYLIIYATHY